MGENGQLLVIINYRGRNCKEKKILSKYRELQKQNSRYLFHSLRIEGGKYGFTVITDSQSKLIQLI